MDFLKQDPLIPGQQIALVSMLEPRNEKLMRKRETWLATNFIKWFLTEHQQAVLHQLKQKKKKITNEFIQEKLDFSFENIQKLYKEYITLNLTQLDDRFKRLHNQKDEVTVSGIKVRGVFPDDDTLIKRQVQKFHEYEDYVDIYTVPVGKWVPYCPQTDKGIKTDYLHDKLNDILKNYHDVNKNNTQMFEERVSKTKAATDMPDSLRQIPFTQPNIPVRPPPQKPPKKIWVPETDEHKDPI